MCFCLYKCSIHRLDICSNSTQTSKKRPKQVLSLKLKATIKHHNASHYLPGSSTLKDYLIKLSLGVALYILS